jgi:mono/diheme cytochrome c family protein
MPSLGWKLPDTQVADILTYVRNNWGNRAPAVSAETVGRIRSALHSGS